MSAVLPKVDTLSIYEIYKKTWRVSLPIGGRTTMIRWVFYLLRILKCFTDLWITRYMLSTIVRLGLLSLWMYKSHSYKRNVQFYREKYYFSSNSLSSGWNSIWRFLRCVYGQQNGTCESEPKICVVQPWPRLGKKSLSLRQWSNLIHMNMSQQVLNLNTDQDIKIQYLKFTSIWNTFVFYYLPYYGPGLNRWIIFRNFATQSCGGGGVVKSVDCC